MNNEMRGYIATRNIYVNYHEENVTEFIDKFLSDKIHTIVGTIGVDRDVIDKTRGYEKGTLLLITARNMYTLREKLLSIVESLTVKEIDFKFIRHEYRIIIKDVQDD